MSTAAGLRAEEVAAQWLMDQGYEIIERNWRTKWCEIDIIAKKNQRLYFIEVKYRRTSAAGGGLSYITPGKLKQMTFAAEMWLSNQAERSDYELSAMSLSGVGPQVEDFIPELT